MYGFCPTWALNPFRKWLVTLMFVPLLHAWICWYKLIIIIACMIHSCVWLVIPCLLKKCAWHFPLCKLASSHQRWSFQVSTNLMSSFLWLKYTVSSNLVLPSTNFWKLIKSTDAVGIMFWSLWDHTGKKNTKEVTHSCCLAVYLSSSCV